MRINILLQSYAGKYVPAISYKIHTSNQDPFVKVPINLQGLAIGDGLCDPETVSTHPCTACTDLQLFVKHCSKTLITNTVYMDH